MRALTNRRGAYKSETSRPGAFTNNCLDVYIRWHNTSGRTTYDKSTTWTRVSMSTSGSTIHPVAQHATSLQHRRLIFNENSETTHTHGLCTRTGPTNCFVLARKSACLFVCTSLYATYKLIGAYVFDVRPGNTSNKVHVFDALPGTTSNKVHVFDALPGSGRDETAYVFDVRPGNTSNKVHVFDALCPGPTAKTSNKVHVFDALSGQGPGR